MSGLVCTPPSATSTSRTRSGCVFCFFDGSSSTRWSTASAMTCSSSCGVLASSTRAAASRWAFFIRASTTRLATSVPTPSMTDTPPSSRKPAMVATAICLSSLISSPSATRCATSCPASSTAPANEPITALTVLRTPGTADAKLVAAVARLKEATKPACRCASSSDRPAFLAAEYCAAPSKTMLAAVCAAIAPATVCARLDMPRRGKTRETRRVAITEAEAPAAAGVATAAPTANARDGAIDDATPDSTSRAPTTSPPMVNSSGLGRASISFWYSTTSSWAAVRSLAP